MTADEYNRRVMNGLISGKPVAQRKGKQTKPELPHMTEAQIQIQCINWFRQQYRCLYNAGKLVHIANERNCSQRQGKELKDMGVRKGIPDLCLFMARKGKHGLFIEMKAPNRYPRPEQKAMMKTLTEEGYMCVVCRSLDEFRDIINNYLI